MAGSLESPVLAQTTSTDGAIKACEATIIGSLVSPASYKPVNIKVYQDGVVILYDSANGYGALLRARAACAFVERPDGLHLVSEPVLTYELVKDICTKQVDGWVAAGNLTKAAAEAFYANCLVERDLGQAKFLQDQQDAGVVYPIPLDSTTIRP